jgi:hypothetical protein
MIDLVTQRNLEIYKQGVTDGYALGFAKAKELYDKPIPAGPYTVPYTVPTMWPNGIGTGNPPVPNVWVSSTVTSTPHIPPMGVLQSNGNPTFISYSHILPNGPPPTANIGMVS